MVKAKFKVGDKVRILPSAVDINVWKEEIGKVGKVTFMWDELGLISIQMFYPCKGGIHNWSVNPDQIEPVIKVGQQLVFNFMK